MLPDTPILNSDGSALPFDATTGTGRRIPCGNRRTTDKIPYFALLIVMIGTTFYQQRQMQKASPPGAASGQQQAILKLMPIMFGIFGYTFPAGLTLYWTVSNTWQIGQQYVLLEGRPHRARTPWSGGSPSSGRRTRTSRAKPGLMARMQERAEQSQKAKGGPAQEAELGAEVDREAPARAPVARARHRRAGAPTRAGSQGARRSRVARPSRADDPNTDPRKRGGGNGGQGDGEAGT